MTGAPDGVVAVDKPAGMTSHDVVDRVRKIFGTRKVGHAGTLDPAATGVLVVGIGRATRFLSYAQAAPKRYTAVARLGIVTTTHDATGKVVAENPVQVERGAFERVLTDFAGDIEQIPPMVSAVKVGGERLYKKARRGEEVERSARRVTIYDLRLLEWRQADHPEATLDLICSGGTYVRTLIHDIGAALGCGAHMVSLRRTEAGGFDEGDAVALEELDPAHLRPLIDALKVLPVVAIDDDAARLVVHGRPLEDPDRLGVDLREGEPVALSSGGNLLAVYQRRGASLVPDRVLSR